MRLQGEFSLLFLFKTAGIPVGGNYLFMLRKKFAKVDNFYFMVEIRNMVRPSGAMYPTLSIAENMRRKWHVFFG